MTGESCGMKQNQTYSIKKKAKAAAFQFRDELLTNVVSRSAQLQTKCMTRSSLTGHINVLKVYRIAKGQGPVEFPPEQVSKIRWTMQSPVRPEVD
jgi:hypothetical protein